MATPREGLGRWCRGVRGGGRVGEAGPVGAGPVGADPVGADPVGARVRLRPALPVRAQKRGCLLRRTAAVEKTTPASMITTVIAWSSTWKNGVNGVTETQSQRIAPMSVMT